MENITTKHGLVHRLRIRLFGEPDPIERQLKEISRQGSGMARIAHLCAFTLILLFSLGSLVALGGDALASIVNEWHHGQVDVPSAISVAVSTLLVACMDTGMLYAASMLRRLAARRADPAEMRLHKAVMAIVAVLEASTYAYMSARYEHPATLVVWGLILARAAAAPLLSVYLSMARPIPVSSRDILYQAELITGMGVLRHVTRLANNPAATLSDLLLMYHAAGTSSESDRERLSDLIAVAQSQLTTPGELVSGTEPGPRFPTGGNPAQVHISPDEGEQGEYTGNLVALAQPELQVVRPAASNQKRRRTKRYSSREAERAAAFAYLAKHPNAPKIALRNHLHINNVRASSYWEEFRNARIAEHIESKTGRPVEGEPVAQ